MANLYKDFQSSTLMSFGKSFARLNGQPLDKSAIWYSKAEADAYALTGSAYVGQPVAVIDETAGKTTLYVVGTNGTLEQIGSLPDGVSLELKNDKVQLKGFDEADTGAQLRKNADGELEWFIPSTDTVDGLQSTVAGLQSDMKTAQEDIASLEGLVGEKAVGTQIDEAIAALNLGETYETKGAAATAKGEIEGVIGEVAEGKTIVEMISDAQTAATYDDTSLINRISAIEGDYLTSEDKTELTGAIATAKQEAIAAVLGEAVSADFDTLKEVADWILSDTTASAELVTRVTNIEKDYLKGADKTALQGEIDALETLVGTLPEGVASTTVVAYIQEVVDALKIGDYAKAADLTALANRVTDVETKLSGIEEGAQVNKIESVDTEQFGLDENKRLTLLDIAIGKVTGLTDALDGKVDKVEGSRLLTEDEATKLEKLVLGDNGEVSVSGKVAAGNVDGLDAWITQRAATLEGLSENNLTDSLLSKLEGISEGAQVNAIDGVSGEFTISADGKVLNINTISMDKITGLSDELAGKVNVVEGMGLSSNDFTDDLLTKLTGIESGAQVNYVKSVTEEFSVSDAGELSVNSINVNKLVQSDNEYLILNGGSSSI